MSDTKAIDDFLRLASRLEQSVKPRNASSLTYWSERADDLTLKFGKPMVVVDQGAHYQVWNKGAAVGKNVVYDATPMLSGGAAHEVLECG